MQKQMLFLVLSGDKLAGNIMHVQEGAAAQLHEVEAFLSDLGIHHKVVVKDDDTLEAFVSLESRLPDLLEKSADDPLLFGLMIGFPATAVAAFGDGQSTHQTLMEFDDEREVFARAGLPYDEMPSFRLSKRCADEEVLILKRWWKTLSDYDMV